MNKHGTAPSRSNSTAYTDWHAFKRDYQNGRSDLRERIRTHPQVRVQVRDRYYMVDSTTDQAVEAPYVSTTLSTEGNIRPSRYYTENQAAQWQYAQNLRDLWSPRQTFCQRLAQRFFPCIANRPRGRKRARAGLPNYRHTDCLNSAVQSLAKTWEDTGLLRNMRRGLHSSALHNMIAQLSPVGTPETVISHQVERIMRNWLATSDRDMPSQLPAAIRNYGALRTNFLQLCEALNGRLTSEYKTRDLYKEFLRSYWRYADTIGMRQVDHILGVRPGDRLKLSHIPQQNPEAFLTSLRFMFGQDRNPATAIREGTLYKLYQADTRIYSNEHTAIRHRMRVLDSVVEHRGRTKSNVTIPVTGKTLQECVDNHLRETELQGRDALWPEGRLRRKNISQSQDTETTQASCLSCVGQPPTTLTLHMDLYSRTDQAGNPLQKPRYLEGEGKKLLKNIPMGLNIPMQVKVGDHYMNRTQLYKVTDLICHKKGGLTEGRYLTLRLFDNGLIQVCDDEQVAEMNEYRLSKCRAFCDSLEEFCEAEKLTCVAVNMKREDRRHDRIIWTQRVPHLASQRLTLPELGRYSTRSYGGRPAPRQSYTNRGYAYDAATGTVTSGQPSTHRPSPPTGQGQQRSGPANPFAAAIYDPNRRRSDK